MDAKIKSFRSCTAVREWSRGASSRSVPLVKILRNSRGLALFMSIALMTIFMFFLSASLYLTRVDTRITANLKMATQAFEVADAGLHHAMAVFSTGYDFDSILSCGSQECTIADASGAISNRPFASGFSYTVSAQNDPGDAGGQTDDTNNTILVISQSFGPAGVTDTVEAYVKGSASLLSSPPGLYVSGSSATPHDDLFFDDDDSMAIVGHDTNPGNILDPWDDTAGPQASQLAVATTSDAVTSALQAEHSTWGYLHTFMGQGSAPSIGTSTNIIDVDELADNFINNGNTVKYDQDGLVTSGSSCASPCQVCTSASPCVFGNSSMPQITYIKDSATSNTVLDGHVRGHGVLVVEGRATIKGDFRFNGLVIHKKTDPAHFISFEGNAWVYGGVIIGSYNGEATFTIEDYARIFNSSQALNMVNSQWGSQIQGPARVIAWQDK